MSLRERSGSGSAKIAKLQTQTSFHDGDVTPFSFTKLLKPDADWDRALEFPHWHYDAHGWTTAFLSFYILSEMDRSIQDQLGDVLHWVRQAVALVCGIVWGAIPLTGVIWLIVFVALSTGLVYGYYAFYLKVDEEEFGGHGQLIQEGLFASLTLFLPCAAFAAGPPQPSHGRGLLLSKLAWILVYSVTHFH